MYPDTTTAIPTGIGVTATGIARIAKTEMMGIEC